MIGALMRAGVPDVGILPSAKPARRVSIMPRLAAAYCA
jgi:hypothetical protein